MEHQFLEGREALRLPAQDIPFLCSIDGKCVPPCESGRATSSAALAFELLGRRRTNVRFYLPVIHRHQWEPAMQGVLWRCNPQKGSWRNAGSLRENTAHQDSSPVREDLSKGLLELSFSPWPQNIWPFKFQRKYNIVGALRIITA